MLADSRNGPLASLDRSTNAGATAAKEEPNDESPIERSPHRQVLQELLVEHSPSRADMSALAKQCPCAARQVAGACAALIGRPSETLVQGTLWPSELPRFAHSGLVPEATRPFWECTALIKMFCRGDVCTPPWVSALYEDIMRKRARSAAMPFNPPEDEDDTLDLNVVPMEEDEDNGSQGCAQPLPQGAPPDERCALFPSHFREVRGHCLRGGRNRTDEDDIIDLNDLPCRGRDPLLPWNDTILPVEPNQTPCATPPDPSPSLPPPRPQQEHAQDVPDASDDAGDEPAMDASAPLPADAGLPPIVVADRTLLTRPFRTRAPKIAYCRAAGVRYGPDRSSVVARDLILASISGCDVNHECLIAGFVTAHLTRPQPSIVWSESRKGVRPNGEWAMVRVNHIHCFLLSAIDYLERTDRVDGYACDYAAFAAQARRYLDSEPYRLLLSGLGNPPQSEPTDAMAALLHSQSEHVPDTNTAPTFPGPESAQPYSEPCAQTEPPVAESQVVVSIDPPPPPGLQDSATEPRASGDAAADGTLGDTHVAANDDIMDDTAGTTTVQSTPATDDWTVDAPAKHTPARDDVAVSAPLDNVLEDGAATNDADASIGGTIVAAHENPAPAAAVIHPDDAASTDDAVGDTVRCAPEQASRTSLMRGRVPTIMYGRYFPGDEDDPAVLGMTPRQWAAVGRTVPTVSSPPRSQRSKSAMGKRRRPLVRAIKKRVRFAAPDSEEDSVAPPPTLPPTAAIPPENDISVDGVSSVANAEPLDQDHGSAASNGGTAAVDDTGSTPNDAVPAPANVSDMDGDTAQHEETAPASKRPQEARVKRVAKRRRTRGPPSDTTETVPDTPTGDVSTTTVATAATAPHSEPANGTQIEHDGGRDAMHHTETVSSGKRKRVARPKRLVKRRRPTTRSSARLAQSVSDSPTVEMPTATATTTVAMHPGPESGAGADGNPTQRTDAASADNGRTEVTRPKRLAKRRRTTGASLGLDQTVADASTGDAPQPSPPTIVTTTTSPAATATQSEATDAPDDDRPRRGPRWNALFVAPKDHRLNAERRHDFALIDRMLDRVAHGDALVVWQPTLSLAGIDACVPARTVEGAEYEATLIMWKHDAQGTQWDVALDDGSTEMCGRARARKLAARHVCMPSTILLTSLGPEGSTTPTIPSPDVCLSIEDTSQDADVPPGCRPIYVVTAEQTWLFGQCEAWLSVPSEQRDPIHGAYLLERTSRWAFAITDACRDVACRIFVGMAAHM